MVTLCNNEKQVAGGGELVQRQAEDQKDARGNGEHDLFLVEVN